MKTTKPFDPLFAAGQSQEATAFVISSKPFDPLNLGGTKEAAQAPQQAVAGKAQQAYSHIDPYTCPARGCGKPMTRARLGGGEEVSFCSDHRIALPLPL